MVVKDYCELGKFTLNSSNFIGSELYGLVYKINDTQCLKIFRSNKIIKLLEKKHPETFLEYLKTLSTKTSSILVIPEDIYTDKSNLVRTYVSEYQEEIFLNSNINDIEISRFMKILEEFYLILSKIEDLVSNDGSPSNLIITNDGVLKMIDLGLSKFEKWMDSDMVQKRNYEILNSSILNAIIRKRNFYDVMDENLIKFVDASFSGDYPFPQLLSEYIEYVNRNYIEVKKVKDLRYPYVGSM